MTGRILTLVWSGALFGTAVHFVNPALRGWQFVAAAIFMALAARVRW